MNKEENRSQAGFIPPHGGYRDLLSFQKAEIIYLGTVRFCERFISPFDRTFDQMMQAARSGKPNLSEGSTVSGTSKKLELNLAGAARVSFEELLRDYMDFLTVRNLPLWPKNSKSARAVRKIGAAKHASYES